MATVKGTITLTSGQIVRCVDSGNGTFNTGRYQLETQNGQDAMGIIRWIQDNQFSMQDVLDILHGVGWITI